MGLKSKVGVIGAGRFGTAIAVLAAKNQEVLLYTRNEENVKSINQRKRHLYLDFDLPERISATSDAQRICDTCSLLFVAVPSAIFRKSMQYFSQFLTPAHVIIHGTKGFDVSDDLMQRKNFYLRREEVYTMSEIIEQETQVIRIGCLSGPNLSTEIMEEQPTATVIASRYKEVMDLGKAALKSSVFRVFESYEIRGAEMAGCLKNIIAIGSGILSGSGYGKNIQAMMITKGLAEIIHLGKALGMHSSIFLGTAGLGDLIATATSKKSRNFSFGYRLGQGMDIETIRSANDELAEGVRTIKIAFGLQKHLNLRLPIISLLYRMVYEGLNLDQSIKYLMNFPYDIDVDFV